MKKNVIQINGGITINVYVSVKNLTYVKKIIFGILIHTVANMENMCDEIVESYNEDINFNEKNQTLKCKISIFYLHFY